QLTPQVFPWGLCGHLFGRDFTGVLVPPHRSPSRDDGVCKPQTPLLPSWEKVAGAKRRSDEGARYLPETRKFQHMRAKAKHRGTETLVASEGKAPPHPSRPCGPIHLLPR